MAKTFFDINGKSIRRTVVTDAKELGELKRTADSLQAQLDDPAVVAAHGQCQVAFVDTLDGFNAIFPMIEDAAGGQGTDVWGKEGLIEETVDFYKSKTGKKHMDV